MVHGNIFVVRDVGLISLQGMQDQCRNIAPRHEALETPVNVTTETYQNWRGDDYTAKTITKLNNEGVETR
jgi:hypothetical protein